MTTTNRLRGMRVVWLAAAFVTGLVVPAGRAADFTWTGAASGNFSVGTNWLGGTAPPNNDPTTTLTFTAGGSTAITATNNIGSPFQVTAVTFNEAIGGQTAGFTVASTNATDLFQLVGASPTITQSGSGPAVFSATGGLIQLAANATVNGTGLGNLTFGGAISETGGARTLTISGTPATQNSRVVVLAATNTLTGGINLDGGNLQVASGATGALGPTTGAAFTVTGNGGVLSTGGTVGSLTVPTIQINGALKFIGSSSLTLTSATTLAGSGNLTMSGTSGMTIQSASDGYTGTVTIDRHDLPNISSGPGTLTLSSAAGSSTGSLLGVPTFNVRAGGALAITGNVTSSLVNNNRIADNAAINLRGGNFSMTGSVTAATVNTETVGPITGAGYDIVTATPGTGAAYTALTATSLGRSDRGTFLFRGTALGSANTGNVGNVLFTTAPTADLVGTTNPIGAPANTTNLKILPYAIADTSGSGTGTALATYDANGVRPLNTSTEYVSSFTGSDNNVRLIASTPNAAAVTVNSLSLATSGAVTGSGTVNVTGGTILNNNSSAAISNTVAFGGAEGNVFAVSTLSVTGNLTGSNGLTKSGTGQLTLSGNNTGLTGQLTLNAGIISVNAGAALPGTGQIVTNATSGGTIGITYTGTTPLTIGRDVAINGGWFSPLATGSAAGPLTFSGTISGSGGLYYNTSTADLFLTGNNTYTGPTRVNNGTIHINSDAALGNGGGFDFGNGTTMGLTLEGDWTTSRLVNLSLTSGTLTLNTQAFNATLNGPVTNFASLGLGLATDTFRKSGTGRLQLNAAGTLNGYSVLLNANGGEVRLAQNGSLLSTAYTLNANTKLVLDNAAVPTGTPGGAVTVDRVSNSATVTMAGTSTLQLIGNASQSVREVIGTVTLTGSNNVIQVDSSGGQTSTLQINNLSASGGSVLVRGTNLGGSTGSLGRIFLTQFNATAIANGQFLANVTAENLNSPGVVDSAVYDTTVGIRIAQSSDFFNGPAIQNAAPTNTPTTANFRADKANNGGNPIPVVDAANTIASLRIASGSSVDFGAATSTLTISSGAILTEAGASPAAITGGGGTLTAGAAVFGFTTNSDLNVAAAVAGTGGLRKSGNGTLTLAGTYGTTGTLTVAGGTLALTGTNTGLPSLALNGGTLTASGSALNGNGALPLAAAGTVTYAGGAVNVPLQFSNTSTTTVATFSAGNTTIANDFILSSSGGITNTFTNGTATNQTTTLSGRISGGNAAASTLFRVSGPADDSSTVVLTNPNNSFTAASISVFEGVLAFTSDAALGAAANGIILNTTTSTRGGLRFDASNIVLNAGRGVSFSDSNAVDTQAFNGEIAGVISGGSTFFKNGTGTLTLSNTANSFTSALQINAGTIAVPVITPPAAANQPLGNSSAAILVGSGTVGALEYTGSAAGTLGRQVTVNGAGGAIIRNSGSGLLTLNATTAVSAGTNPVTFDGAGNITVATPITGTSAASTLTKTGVGRLELQGVNNYAGNTTISGGTLALTGTGSFATSPVVVVGPTASGPILDVTALTGGNNFDTGTNRFKLAPGQTLKGYGTVVGNVLVPTGDTLAPGGSIGTESFVGDLALDGTYQAEVSSSPPAADKLAVTGNLALNNTSSILDLPLSNSYDNVTPLQIATYSGTLTGTFNQVNNLPGSYTLNYGTGTNSAITLTPSAVPEPGTLALTGLAAAGTAGWWKRRRRSASATPVKRTAGAPKGLPSAPPPFV